MILYSRWTSKKRLIKNATNCKYTGYIKCTLVSLPVTSHYYTSIVFYKSCSAIHFSNCRRPVTKNNTCSNSYNKSYNRSLISWNQLLNNALRRVVHIPTARYFANQLGYYVCLCSTFLHRSYRAKTKHRQRRRFGDDAQIVNNDIIHYKFR